MKRTCCDSHTGVFVLGMSLGLALGAMVTGLCCHDRPSVKKVAKNTAHTVADAMDNLRDSLKHYL